MRIAAPAFAFVGSGCLLVLEIVAARLIAPDLGVSLYTWTSVIGVVLAGVTLGNFLGGRLADRRPETSTLAVLYLAAAAASLVVLGVLHAVHSIELPASAPALLQVLWVTALLFLLPATLLAMPTPLLTRLSLGAVEEGGRVVGRIQAAAALGSIVGTFLTGFWLISWFGTRHIVAGIAVVLVLLAAGARPAWLRPRGVSSAAGLLVALALAGGAVGAGWAAGNSCFRESDYYCIALVPDASSPAASRSIYLDGLLHATVDLSRPDTLVYSYEDLYASILKAERPLHSRLDAFFLGGGGYVFPRWVVANYGGRSTVAEIDPEVTRVAEQYLALRLSSRLAVRTGDARRVLASLPASVHFDAVIGDAFNGMEVPWQLTTRQFDELVSAHLRPRGIFLLNVIDGVHEEFLRSEVRTLREVFPYVGLAASPSTWPPTGVRTSFVLVASKGPPAKRLPVVSAASLDHFVAHGHSVVLTDDHAPVEQLLAPVSAQLMRAEIATSH
jgi:spermidine synthase